ncbi:MAG TPA: multiheme c-type cytochrome [Kofleriaceae bacterium]|nr:multiheme c-type cytochrome [Kofleriaceae bacterium]
MRAARPGHLAAHHGTHRASRRASRRALRQAFRRGSRLAIHLAVAAAAACGPPGLTTSPSAAREQAPAWQVRPLGGARPIDPGTADDTLLDADGCARCHAAVAAEWSASRHALAWTNGIFQREYAARPLTWCVNCHAPLTTQAAGRFRDRGVDCATCHVRRGALVSAHRRPGSPHATVEDPGFGSPGFCADCHQFTFPVLTADGAVTRLTAHPMQTTVESFRAGPYATQRDGCMACHGSAADHAFPGGHDPGMLEAALDVTWCRRGGDVEVAVRNAAAGHAVPTGDIHRHMNLRVWRSSAPEALFEAFYGRRFDPADDGGKRTVWDSTILPAATRVHTVALAGLGGDDAAEPINLELSYVFLERELPRRGELVATEPFTTSVVRRRAAPDELRPCPPGPSAR